MNYYLTWFSTKDCMSPYIRKDLWNEALEYLKRTNDGDGFRVMLAGA